MKRPRLARGRARVERSGYSGFHFQLGTRSGLLRSCSLGREGAFAVYARPLKVERYIKFRAPREHSSLHCAVNVKGPFVSQPCSGSFFLHAASEYVHGGYSGADPHTGAMLPRLYSTFIGLLKVCSLPIQAFFARRPQAGRLAL